MSQDGVCCKSNALSRKAAGELELKTHCAPTQKSGRHGSRAEMSQGESYEEASLLHVRGTSSVIFPFLCKAF